MTHLYSSGTVLRTMLMIRLQRVGRKNHAEFRVVVTEKTRAAKSSNYKELVGHYNPHTNDLTLEKKSILHWITMGAQVSPTVHNLLIKEGVIKGKKINVLPKKTPIAKEVALTKKEKDEKITEEKTARNEEETEDKEKTNVPTEEK